MRRWKTKSNFFLSECAEMKRMQFRLIMLSAIYIWFGASEANAQMPYTNNSERADIISSVYLEIWGNSGGFTMNYDFIVNGRSGMRVGLFGFTDRDFSEIVSTGFVMTGNLFLETICINWSWEPAGLLLSNFVYY